jgi:hypothetical protein
VAASIRNGKNAGLRLERVSATTRPSASTPISTITNSLTSSQNPSRTSGKAFVNASQSKNVSRTFGQPLLVRMSAARSPSTTTVETPEIAAP